MGRLTQEEFQPVSCIESSLSVHYKNAVRPACYMSRRPSLHTRLLQFVRIRICRLFPVSVHAGLQLWSWSWSACVSARLDVLEGNPTAVITLSCRTARQSRTPCPAHAKVAERESRMLVATFAKVKVTFWPMHRNYYTMHVFSNLLTL